MTKLIVSLDLTNSALTYKLIDLLSSRVEYFKVGIVPYTLFGDELLRELHHRQKKVFLDLKFHDIPNTVRSAIRAACEKNVHMLTLHCLGGVKMLRAAVEGINEINTKSKPILLGVTVLTSMNQDDLNELGIFGKVAEKVIALAKLGKQAGLNGVIASALEIKNIKEKIGEDFLVVTPGVRPDWLEKSAKEDDQKRVMTPREAAYAGADYIVVGRPIIEAKDPLMVTEKILEELAS